MRGEPTVFSCLLTLLETKMIKKYIYLQFAVFAAFATFVYYDTILRDKFKILLSFLFQLMNEVLLFTLLHIVYESPSFVSRTKLSPNSSMARLFLRR